MILIMAAPCLFEPTVFLEKSRAARWISISFSIFWGLRLYFQWFVYQRELWMGKKLETIIHWVFSFVWLTLAALFAFCAYAQS
jgi:hypothetical protein